MRQNGGRGRHRIDTIETDHFRPERMSWEIRIGYNDLVAMAKSPQRRKKIGPEKWMDAFQHSRSFTC